MYFIFNSFLTISLESQVFFMPHEIDELTSQKWSANSVPECFFNKGEGANEETPEGSQTESNNKAEFDICNMW